ncbi:hypothetical protein [Streptomonospora litoralis]|uniref:Uncharacterized protein n=1 Tax=Streptomonospora litoralis TaxID=2498135 RepID=A0A4P6Q415_9ACTN|nr:hypothetical protein [Streptomonospora litoralis]QBI53447.1 hypothetical protein EKD16_08265 [Streptomonospora litoralis]
MRRVSDDPDAAGHRVVIVGGPLDGRCCRVDVTPAEGWHIEPPPDDDPASWWGPGAVRVRPTGPRVHHYVLRRAELWPVPALYEHAGVQDSVTITDPDTAINLDAPPAAAAPWTDLGTLRRLNVTEPRHLLWCRACTPWRLQEFPTSADLAAWREAHRATTGHDDFRRVYVPDPPVTGLH